MPLARARFRISLWGSICILALLLETPALALAPQANPPSAPALTTDSNFPNLFYGAVPSKGYDLPVVVFVHGLGGNFQDWIEVKNCPTIAPVGGCQGSGNYMYDYTYQAGFRTVFMSMSADNSNNTLSIQTNAAMLRTLFPAILSHFNVSKVYFVCHSKGGLDLEDAIANPAWIGMATAVMQFGTPNQGDALADWIFSPAGNGLGELLGLLTPGVQSLEIANVLQLRMQWDPILEKSGIPFYTVSGNTYKCGIGQGGNCPTAETGPILVEITTPAGGNATPCGGPATAPCNDGLVTQPETLLPTTYSMELGVIAANHYLLRMGNNAFPYINASLQELFNQQQGVPRVATGGFGDPHNTYAWSMAWFNNNLYVGTGREVNCVTYALSAIQIGIPILYPPTIGDCPPDYHDLELQAEIWQYNPATNIWTNVFQSPNSLTTVDNGGNTVATARDIGFRSLSVVTEPGGVTALYAGGVTSEAMFESPAPFGTWPPPRILRSTDGVNWAPLPQDPGTFLGDLSMNGTPQYPNLSIRAGQQLNGVLFLQVGDFPGEGRVFSSVPGQNPATGDNAFQWASPTTDIMPVWILQEFNNYIYAGTGLPPAAGATTYGVYKTDGTGSAPYSWTPVITDGGYGTNPFGAYAISMTTFATPDCPAIGCLYVGTDEAAEIVRIHSDDSWDLVVGDPRPIPSGLPGAGEIIAPLSGIGEYFDNGFTGNITRMAVGSQGLYAATWDWSADLYPVMTAPSSLWSQEFGMDIWRTLDATNWYMVTKVGFGDGNNQEGRTWAATPSGLYMGTARFVGGTQVFLVDNGEPAGGPLAAPLLYSAPGALGGPVSLTWTAVSGAVDYLVYRISVSASTNMSPPPSLKGLTPSQLAAACNSGGAAASLDICYMFRASRNTSGAAVFGYPSPPALLGRVTAPAYSEASLSKLQSLYFVRTEDAFGNLSAPSNVVGGPSLAAQ